MNNAKKRVSAEFLKVRPLSRLGVYRKFVQEMRRLHPRCECCGLTARAAGQAKLYCHHLLRVAVLGVEDPMLVEPANCLVLCNQCHCLWHAGRRRYEWDLASRKRGHALR